MVASEQPEADVRACPHCGMSAYQWHANECPIGHTFPPTLNPHDVAFCRVCSEHWDRLAVLVGGRHPEDPRHGEQTTVTERSD